MRPPLRLRLMTRMDLPFADSLRGLAGWNQTIRDWQRFVTMEPSGCFVAEWSGTFAGTATTTTYGAKLAWIGMVLVHPDYRRRGIGRALLDQCIEYLRHQGARCIKLDATPLGKKVYSELGFKDEGTIKRWEHSGFHSPSCICPPIRNWRDADELKIDSFDAAAFGISRTRLVRALAAESRSAFVFQADVGGLAGYGMLRNGARALYLGPIAARSTGVGISLIEALVASSDGQKIFWDIPVENAAAAAWAAERGFTVQRSLTRMYLGENLAPGNLRDQFALAGPELG